MRTIVMLIGFLSISSAYASDNLDKAMKRNEQISKIRQHEFNHGRFPSEEVIQCITDKGVKPQAPEFDEVRLSCEANYEKAKKEEIERAEIDNAVSKVLIEDWTRTYMQCAINTVPQVDDGLSDAQTVAFALGSRCKDAYTAINTKTRDNLVIHLHPRLTEVVLLHRTAAAKRKPSGKDQPKPKT